MSNFNTVNEVTRWRAFTVGDAVYDLSHLDAHWAEYQDTRDPVKVTTYRFIVTYGLHCFTKALPGMSDDDEQRLMYIAPRESRPFNFERYELSKQLPAIIRSLGRQETLVAHAGYGKYAIVKVVTADGREVDYLVPFMVFKERKKLRLHVQSAYPLDQQPGRVQKVNFFLIARRLQRNEQLPRPFK